MQVTLYTFEDNEGDVQTFSTIHAKEAREVAEENQWLCIANIFEYSDGEVAFDYRKWKVCPECGGPLNFASSIPAEFPRIWCNVCDWTEPEPLEEEKEEEEEVQNNSTLHRRSRNSTSVPWPIEFRNHR